GLRPDAAVCRCWLRFVALRLRLVGSAERGGQGLPTVGPVLNSRRPRRTAMGGRELQGACPTLASSLVGGLLQLGVRQAFGVSGGAMAALWHAMSASALQVCHFRHESGAAFAAAESHFASGRPVLVFTTTGPGLTNALT